MDPWRARMSGSGLAAAACNSVGHSPVYCTAALLAGRVGVELRFRGSTYTRATILRRRRYNRRRPIVLLRRLLNEFQNPVQCCPGRGCRGDVLGRGGEHCPRRRRESEVRGCQFLQGTLRVQERQQRLQGPELLQGQGVPGNDQGGVRRRESKSQVSCKWAGRALSARPTVWAAHAEAHRAQIRSWPA